MFCVFGLTNTGFVQCYSLGSRKVCCTLELHFALFSNFCFAWFASQTLGLCSAFPSAHVKSVTLLLRFSQNFVLRVLRHKHRVCAVLFPRLPQSLFYACVYFGLFSNFLLCAFCLQCFIFPFGSPQVYTLLVFFVLLSLLLLCLLCPTSSGLCGDFSPAPLEFARSIFCFVFGKRFLLR